MTTFIIILIALILPCYLFAIYMHFKKKREKKETEERQKYIDWQMQRKRNRFVNKTEEWIGYQITSLFYDGELPFDMNETVFVYVESNYNEQVNCYIQNHWEEINNEFEKYGYRFIYVPQWKPDTSRLDLANLDNEKIQKVKNMLASMTTTQYSKHLMKVLGFDVGDDYCGIFHFAKQYNAEKDGFDKTKFTLCSMKELDEEEVAQFFSRYLHEIAEQRLCSNIRYYSLLTPLWNPQWNKEIGELGYSPVQETIESEFPIKMKEIAENIKKGIETLKEAGYYEMLLHTLGDDLVNELKSVQTVPALSRMEITEDYRIILTDYGKEVKITPIQKALYIFYLRHPEGVEFKVLSAYYDEILAIYKVLSNRENTEKQRESVRRLVDVTDNAINEKCSRIKEAFLKVADDFIAKNYYIVAKGKQKRFKNKYGDGIDFLEIKHLKKVVLPRELVTYPEEIRKIAIIQPTDKITQALQRLKDERSSLSEIHHKLRDKSNSKSEMIQLLTEHLNRFPTSYIAYLHRAALYAEVGRYEEAIADNQILIDYDEQRWGIALNNQAEAYCLSGQYEKALATINRYFEVFRKEIVPQVYCTRADIYKQMGMQQEAEEDMKQYRKLNQ